MNVWTALTSTFKEPSSIRARRRRSSPSEGEAVPLEWREVYAVALYTYLRPGELRVLRWSDVDLAAGLVHVTKAWDYAEKKKLKQLPKTESGIRTVPIESSLRPLLERMRKGQDASALVVPCLSNFGEDHLAEVFRRHLLAATVDRPALHASTHTHVQANLRSCRDSGITWLAMTGLDVLKIKRRAGHDKVDTTDGYVKLAEDHAGVLGVPFGPLPASLVACEPRVTCEPSDPLTVDNHSRSSDNTVPEEGVARSCTESTKWTEYRNDRRPTSGDEARSASITRVPEEGVETARPCDPRENEPSPVTETADARPATTEDDAPSPAVVQPRSNDLDPIEAALADALSKAAAVGRFDVVAQLARELEARRLAREPNVVALARTPKRVAR